MAEWHATVEVSQLALNDDQIDILTDELPGYAVLAHSADRGRLTMRFTVNAATLRQATDVALRAARHACGVAFAPGVSELTQIRVLPVDDQVKELEYPQPQDLVGYVEIAEILGVSRQRARELATTNPDFPRPLAQLAASPVYTLPSVTAFAARWPRRRTGRPRKKLLSESIREHAEKKAMAGRSS